MKFNKKKFFTFWVFGAMFLLLFKFSFDYYDYSKVFHQDFNGKIVRFGETRDTRSNYVILSDHTRVYTGSYYISNSGFKLKKNDTLKKRSQSFYLLLKRNEELVDSFKSVYADCWVSKYVIK